MKYRWYSIVFWVLLEQFKLFFNFYFFAVSLTQCFERFAVSSPLTSLGPWFIVFFISLLKEGHDDYKRHERDRAINNQLYITYKNGIFYKKKSSEIEVGDLIILEKDERVPADMIILKTQDASGQLFIRTDQLDGETDWKLRSAVSSTQKMDFENIEDVCILVEEPNKDIYSLKGTISRTKFDQNILDSIKFEKTQKPGFLQKMWSYFEKKEEIVQIPSSKFVTWLFSNEVSEEDPSIKRTVNIDDNTNFMVEGISLENTLWMNTVVATCSTIGRVIYTGNDTKAMRNTSKPRNKSGMFDIELNMYSKFLGMMCASVAFFFAYMKGFNSHFLIAFVKFLFLFSSVIPISLKVTVEMARYVYSYQIHNDKNIPNTIVRNSTLPEELGRISYFLTDKTGTLTKNEMEMRKIHVGTFCYTQDLNEEITKCLAKYAHSQMNSNVFQRNRKDTESKLYDLVEGLSVCHNVTPILEDGNMTYQASSPDEVAIVRWTQSVGVKLYKRDRYSITILDPLDESRTYEILHMFPFTSESKRMGIIVKNEEQITFFMKGADVVMNKIIQHQDWVNEETENMARDGLRTLVIGKKILSEEEYMKFDKEYNKAKTSLENRNKNIEAVMATLECNLTVLGLTGVEDTLQDNVKITLENLKNGGLKIWMLTGDKIETAISIAVSSRLFERDTHYKVISNTTDTKQILDILGKAKKSKADALVVDGISVSTIIEECFDEFIDACMNLKAFIGCRFSPTQKALVARALRIRSGKIVCCIGDGGNDVSMITEANLGIGLVGKEGNQASLAADYSIEKFCYVTDLLFWHGRNSYKNSATIANLVIHRGTVLSVLNGLFCALINFIPFNLHKGVIMVAYISCYTFFPIFSSAFTTDVSRGLTEKFPELYKELVEEPLLSTEVFALWNFMSFTQGTLIIAIMVWYFEKELFSITTLTFSSLIVNEIFMVFLSNSRINKHIVMACGLSAFLYLLSFFVLGSSLYIDMPVYIFVAKVLIVNMFAITPKLVEISIRLYRPSTPDKLEYCV